VSTSLIAEGHSEAKLARYGRGGGWIPSVAKVPPGGLGHNAPGIDRVERGTSGGGMEQLQASTPCAASPLRRVCSKQLHLLERAGARQENATLRPEPSVSEFLWLRRTPVRKQTSSASREARKTSHQSTKNEAFRAASRIQLFHRHGTCSLSVLPRLQSACRGIMTLEAI